ncbi:MAG TPA: hypothetical protein VFE51_00565 [Verrucomicrobiae bacterium]|nr:hypothetical protein [Verrucomicrobiae bacterium]
MVSSTARFNSPGGMAFDSVGNTYVADILNHTIRKVTQVGTNWGGDDHRRAGRRAPGFE